MDIIRGLFVAINDILCNDYTEYTDRCDTLGPAPAPSTPNPRHYTTFMWVLTDVLASTKRLRPSTFRNGKVPDEEFIHIDMMSK